MQTIIGRFTCCAVMAVLFAPAAPAAEEDVFARIARYDFGASREALTSLEAQVRETGPEEYGAIEQGLLVVLESPEATVAGKQFACRLLRRIGSDRAVPVVAKLLTDEKLSHMARYALDGIPGDAADKALLEAMRAAGADKRIGMIGSLGSRRVKAAVPDLAGLATSENADVARAAMRALGAIGGADAARALDRANVPAELDSVRTDAYLACVRQMAKDGKRRTARKMYWKVFDSSGDTLARTVALRGVVSVEGSKAVPLLLDLIEGEDPDMARAARTLMVEIPGRRATRKIVRALPSLKPSAQAAVLEALTARAERLWRRGTINDLAQSEDPAVRLAALECLGVMGNASSADVLIGAMTEAAPDNDDAGKKIAETARESLQRLRGRGVDERILARMDAAEEALRIELIESLAARRASSAVPRFLDIASNEEGGARSAALKALGDLAGEDALPCLYALLKKNGGDRSVERAVSDACVRRPDREGCTEDITGAMSDAEAPARTAMLRIVGRLGGEKALHVMSASMSDSDEDIRNEAMRVVANWSNIEDLDRLLAFARKTEDENHRDAALQGCVRLVRLPNNRSDEETLALYKALLEIPMRPDIRKTIFDALSRVRHEDALKILIAGLSDEQCRESAARSVVELADRFGRSHAEIVKSGLTKVIETTTEDKLRERASEMLTSLEEEKP